MSSKAPPIPAANRSPSGTGGQIRPDNDDKTGKNAVPNNLDEQDRQGTIKQNTTHQGYQQDR